MGDRQGLREVSMEELEGGKGQGNGCNFFQLKTY